MHACKVLQRIFDSVLSELDVRNARNLLGCVDALLAGRRLTLTELARHWVGAERVSAPLKRVDRLLGNRQVQAARSKIYQVAMAWLLRHPEPVIIVDWSELKSDGRWQLLRAALVARGRTLTLYEEIHPEKIKFSAKVEAAFLGRLAAWMPAGIKPIIVVDAGFHVPWVRAVACLGWHWLARVGGRVQVRAINTQHQTSTRWRSYKTLFAQANATPADLGAHELAASQKWPCRLVLVKRPPKGRRQRRRDGRRASGGHSIYLARRNREPWLLAASPSLQHRSSRQIVALYGKRMQIEQTFRDLKSHRYGCAFEDTLTRTGPRLEVLLMIQMLASLAAWLEGLSPDIASRFAPSRTLIGRYSIIWLGWHRLAQTTRQLFYPPSLLEQALCELIEAAHVLD